MDSATSSPPPLAGEGQGGGAQYDTAFQQTPSPTLPRKRGRGRTEFAACNDSTQPKHELPPQIDLDHALVLRDLIDRAFGQHRTFVQAGDFDAELAHERHIVLDHHHGALAIDLLE
jgi:hypothetical protein